MSKYFCENKHLFVLKIKLKNEIVLSLISKDPLFFNTKMVFSLEAVLFFQNKFSHQKKKNYEKLM